MKTYIDLQTSTSRKLKYRVRIISKHKQVEKVIGYFKTAEEAIEVKRIVDKTIGILESI